MIRNLGIIAACIAVTLVLAIWNNWNTEPAEHPGGRQAALKPPNIKATRTPTTMQIDPGAEHVMFENTYENLSYTEYVNVTMRAKLAPGQRLTFYDYEPIPAIATTESETK